ncbi:hypothetical protein MRX96_020737 [Rhipicephalus microplus]
MHAPPIVLELYRLNAQFRLFALRKTVQYRDLIIRPKDVMYPVDGLTIHPAERTSFPHRRLTAQETNVLAGRRAQHAYTDGSSAERLAGAACVVFGHECVLRSGRGPRGSVKMVERSPHCPRHICLHGLSLTTVCVGLQN